MRIFFLVLTCCMLASGSAFAQQSDETDALQSITLPPELDRVLRDYERGWAERDAAALAALFTPDGFVLRPGHPPVRGRAAVEEAYQNSGGPLHLRAFAFESSDSIAYIIGGYSSNPERPDGGKFVLTLRQAPDGHWLIAADIDNQN